jgi:aminoglycoside 6'-N-acetyltransferase I
MTIIDLTATDSAAIHQAATILTDAFRGTGSAAWQTYEEAVEEVNAMLVADRVCRIAIDSGRDVLGWIGGISTYDGHVWELHPLVVREDQRMKGVGRALVADLEEQVAKRGGLTVQLGTDDEYDRTSLGAVDLYPNVLDKVQAIRNLRSHPFEFYQKLGYEIVGVIPDANGFGKPDIIMAKRVRQIS